MGDGEITEADLPELLKMLTAEDLIFAIRLLKLARENRCDLRGAVSAMKARKKRNERSSAYNQRHKAERNVYSAMYMRVRRSKKAEQTKEGVNQTAGEPVEIMGQ